MCLKRTIPHTSAYPLEHEPLHFSHGQDERSLSRVSISSQHQTESFTCAGFMSEAPQAPAIPPSEGGVPLSPPQCRYETRKPPIAPGASNSCWIITPKRVVSTSTASIAYYRVSDSCWDDSRRDYHATYGYTATYRGKFGLPS